jgi:hypothetical protein
VSWKRTDGILSSVFVSYKSGINPLQNELKRRNGIPLNCELERRNGNLVNCELESCSALCWRETPAGKYFTVTAKVKISQNSLA